MRTPLPRDLEAEHAPGSPRGPAEQAVALDRGFGSIMGETWLVRTAAGLHAWTRDSRMDPFAEVRLDAHAPLRVEGAGLQLSVRLREAGGTEHVLPVPIHVERDALEALTDAVPVARDESPEPQDAARVVVPVAPEERPEVAVAPEARPEIPRVPVARDAATAAPARAAHATGGDAGRSWVWRVLGICALGCVFGGLGGDGWFVRVAVAVFAVFVARRWFWKNATPDSASAAVDAEPDEDATPALHAAAFTGDLDSLRRLLDAGAKPDHRDPDGETALHRAATDEHEAVALLLARGADPDARDAASRTPLHVASSWHAAECVELLLRAGADVRAEDSEGATPLHLAEGDAGTVSLLLAAGADVHARARDRDTPLHRAAAGDDPDGVRRLLAAGADPEATNDAGQRPAALAEDGDVRIAFDG